MIGLRPTINKNISMPQSSPDIFFEYTINFEDNTSQSFKVKVNPASFIIEDKDDEPGPDWALLETNKCVHCPYQTGAKKFCPVAKNLAAASEAFKEQRSVTKVTVFVKSPERFYGKKTDLQTALFSLFGLIMASSDCPHLHIFKSMARFHLPFSTSDETIIRALGMYLLSEYLKQQDSPDHKISLDGLLEKYSHIEKVNQGIIKRIRSLKGGDANKNAIIVLDNFSALLPLEISTGLSEVREFFKG